MRLDKKFSDRLSSFKTCWISLLRLFMALRRSHFKTKIEEHIKKDNKSHIFTHLHSTATCFDSYNSISFKTVDKANSKFNLKIKEAVHINRRKPNWNAPQNHLALTLSLYLLSPLFFYVFVFFCVSLSSIMFIISDTNCRHLYCYNYTWLLLYLITIHLVSLFLFYLLFSLSLR